MLLAEKNTVGGEENLRYLISHWLSEKDIQPVLGFDSLFFFYISHLDIKNLRFHIF